MNRNITHRELSIITADKLLRSYGTLTRLQWELEQSPMRTHFTLAEVEEMLSYPNMGYDDIRTRGGKPSDPVTRAVLHGEDLLRKLNAEIDSENNRIERMLEFVHTALTEIQVATDYMDDTVASIMRHVYLDGQSRNSYPGISTHLVNKALDTATCCLAQCLRFRSFEWLLKFHDKLGSFVAEAESIAA